MTGYFISGFYCNLLYSNFQKHLQICSKYNGIVPVLDAHLPPVHVLPFLAVRFEPRHALLECPESQVRCEMCSLWPNYFSRLGPIQQFWFTKSDTESTWMVLLVCHDILCWYALTLRLGPIQQFWFAEPDTEPNWVVHLVRHDTLCRYVLTLHPNSCFSRELNSPWDAVRGDYHESLQA